MSAALTVEEEESLNQVRTGLLAQADCQIGEAAHHPPRRSPRRAVG